MLHPATIAVKFSKIAVFRLKLDNQRSAKTSILKQRDQSLKDTVCVITIQEPWSICSANSVQTVASLSKKDPRWPRRNAKFKVYIGNTCICFKTT